MKQESADVGMQVAMLVDFDQEGGGFPTAITGISDAPRGVGLVCTLIGFGRVVFYYQTLTAGGDAIVAAYHAAPPV